MKTIVIAKPHIESLENVSRLVANIKADSFTKDYYFEVDKKFEQYFCAERCDAFLLGMFYFALVNNYNIVCEAPISERLYYQLTVSYIPTVVKNDPDLFHELTISAELDSTPINNAGAVGTAASGGIDSFYTIVRNLHNKSEHYNLTHLLITNSFNIYYDEKNTRQRFGEICEYAETIADDFGMELVEIYSNEHEFWYPHYVDLYCFRYMSLPYALQKLFAVYNYSTGYQYNDFTFKAANRDASHYDFFSVHLISSENLTIYSSGGEVGRPGKATYIADNTVVQRRLHVCNLHTENCSVCEKCLRTQFNFYACGKLESFSKAFNIQEFYKRKDKTLIGMLSARGSFERENIELLKRNNIKISFKVSVLGGIGHVYYLFRQTLKHVPFVYSAYKKIKTSNKDNVMVKLDKYNLEKDYAKKCNPDIVDY